jgi:hypothetical protein
MGRMKPNMREHGTNNRLLDMGVAGGFGALRLVYR